MAKKRKGSSLKVLEKNATKLIRQEYMDYDYVDKLSSEEKQWLADFTDEYYNASVGKQSDEGKNNRFMKSKKEIKDCTDRNNWKNNDVYGKKRAKRELVGGDYNSISDFLDIRADKTINTTENAIVDILDKVKNFENTSKDTDNDSDNPD